MILLNFVLYSILHSMHQMGIQPLFKIGENQRSVLWFCLELLNVELGDNSKKFKNPLIIRK